MKTIACLIPTIDQLGGAEQQMLLLARGFALRGWRVSVCALSGTGGARSEELQRDGIRFHTLGFRKGLADPRGWLRAYRWLRAERPDVLHAHLPHATWLARCIRMAVPLRAVVDTIHTSAPGGAARVRLYRWTNWLTDRVSAVSADAARVQTEARAVTQRRLVLVPNGLNTAQWESDPVVRAEMRAKLGLREEFLWFAAGRLEPVKDYPALLHAYAHVDLPGVLVIAGDGSQREALVRLARDLHLEDRVRFLGFVRNTLPWLQAADGYVLTSRWEGLPMGILEAAACALPTVATDVAGTRELISHGHTGILAEAGNVRAIAAALERVMKMRLSERSTLGECARLQAIDRYDLKRVLDAWEELYAEILDANPLPRRWGGARITHATHAAESPETTH